MTGLVTYELDDGVATIAMDDGKANALSIPMLSELHIGLDRAEQDGAVVVLTGRDERFSAGLHLPTLRVGGEQSEILLRSANALLVRVLTFPTPVVIACSGHAMAHAAFLLLCADDRIGAGGPYKIAVNEVAIGIVVPRTTIVLSRYRLNPTHLHRALALAEEYSPDGAVDAGFLDRVVPAAEVLGTAQDAARRYSAFDRKAYRATKKRLREEMLPRMQGFMDEEFPAPASAG